jgi:hypothetical protein
VSELHLVSPPPIIQAGDQDLRDADSRVDAAEGEGFYARWEYGQALLRRRIGKQLPKGLLDEEARKTGKSRTELKYRAQFAERFPTEVEVANALATYGSWHNFVAGKSAAELLGQSNENEWYTPAKYVEAACAVLGGIDLDPASSSEANETVRATRFYTESDNSFIQEWAGRVWLNPPYGGIAASFVGRLVDEFWAGEVTAAIALVNAHCTDTEWFQPLFNQPLCFTDHRIDFDSAGREKTSTSNHGSVFAYFGPDPLALAQEFSQFGALVVPA